MAESRGPKVIVAVVIIVLSVTNLYQGISRIHYEARTGLQIKEIQATSVLRHRDTVIKEAQAISAVRDRDAVIRDFHLISYNSSVWANSRWLGIPTEQNPNDVWVTQEIIFDVRPDYFVEAGTFKGGSAALWATILAQVNPQGRVITIDVKDQAEEARRLPVVKDKVDFLLGSSTAPDIVAEVTRRVQGKKVVVLLDSDHSKKHVLDEIRAYSALVPVGSYLVVQDTNVNGHPVQPNFGPGPMEAVREFLATDARFQSDHTREKFLYTHHPDGYLRRLR